MRLIAAAGFTPVQRDTLYGEVRRYRDRAGPGPPPTVLRSAWVAAGRAGLRLLSASGLRTPGLPPPQANRFTTTPRGSPPLVASAYWGPGGLSTAADGLPPSAWLSEGGTEGAVIPVPEPKRSETLQAADDAKGLKTNAVGMLSSIVIGIASTAPAYSLAVTLGLTAVAGMGLKSPAIMIVSFVPMILIASSYYYLNKADPDCGTTFSWVTRAMGPRTGWVTGWVMVAADIIVMASPAQITGTYFFRSLGCTDSPIHCSG